MDEETKELFRKEYQAYKEAAGAAAAAHKDLIATSVEYRVVLREAREAQEASFDPGLPAGTIEEWDSSRPIEVADAIDKLSRKYGFMAAALRELSTRTRMVTSLARAIIDIEKEKTGEA